MVIRSNGGGEGKAEFKVYKLHIPALSRSLTGREHEAQLGIHLLSEVNVP